MRFHLVLAFSVIPGLAGCGPDATVATTRMGQDGRYQQHADGAAFPPGTASNAEPDDVAVLVPEGATVIDTVRGDLTGQGGSDALLVVSPEMNSSAALGEGPSRTVMLFTRDRSGRLAKSAENSRMVPCERCGGIAGDPYGYARIHAGNVTVAISGGSRERWFDDYVFRYDPEAGTWLLDRVVRGVTDTQTGLQRHIELGESDFGEIGFADFDPVHLPAVAILE